LQGTSREKRCLPLPDILLTAFAGVADFSACVIWQIQSLKKIKAAGFIGGFWDGKELKD
jgi:hypothetical protein